MKIMLTLITVKVIKYQGIATLAAHLLCDVVANASIGGLFRSTHRAPELHPTQVRSTMKPVRILLLILSIMLVAGPAWAETEDNSTPGMAKPVPEQPAQKPETATGDTVSTGRFPLDIQGRGTDQSGTLLSYKLKEEVIASKLFDLKVSEKKKFVLHIVTQAEFPDRPSIASQYSIVLVYQEDAGTLAYYLNHYQGQVHAEAVTAEMQKILEWTYANLKRYHYLLEE